MAGACELTWAPLITSPSSPPTITSSPVPVVITSLPPSSVLGRDDPIEVGRARVVAGERGRVPVLGRGPVGQAAVADHEVVAVGRPDGVAV